MLVDTDVLQLGDALIAATALEQGWALLIANVRHFAPIEGLTVERFDPAQGVEWSAVCTEVSEHSFGLKS